MALIKWDESFSVNVTEIDRQHKKLVNMINEFYDSLREDSKQAFHKLLNSLVDYTYYHFSTEEKYFDIYSYENSDSHKQEHKYFIEKINNVKNRMARGEFVISLEITNFLKDWLITHIKETDKKYSQCFNDNGLR
ncbi:MAG: hemerythrin family protein [Nitrospirae bacterium]|nr:hemerythrin family protein [Nitrospirota bacterium]